ncbi:MAG: hypothetical protein ACFFAT_03345 [Promethearchaeota archaeon]
MENTDLGSVRGSAAIGMVGLGIINELSELIPLIKIKKHLYQV